MDCGVSLLLMLNYLTLQKWLSRKKMLMANFKIKPSKSQWFSTILPLVCVSHISKSQGLRNFDQLT